MPLLSSYKSSIGNSGGVRAVLVTQSDGREQMIFHTSIGGLDTTSGNLQHLWIDWATKGIYARILQVFLSTHIDDTVLFTGLYNFELGDSNTGNFFTISSDDLGSHAPWMVDLNKQLCAGSNFKIELAINSNGVLETIRSPRTFNYQQTDC